VSRFLDARRIQIDEVVKASRKLGRADAKALIESSSRIIVAKGKNVRRFPGGKATDEVLTALLGPTGNLRAPTVLVGRTLLVGFDESAFDEILSG
jgi:arsenate reductase-like glutaredoxin family protein